MKYEGVSKMSESSMLEVVKNCLIRRPKVRIAFGLASNNFMYLLSNTALCAGCFGNDFILEAYCRDSFARLAPILLWHRKVAMPETMKVQAWRRHRERNIVYIFPQYRNTPIAQRNQARPKRVWLGPPHHYHLSEQRLSDGPVTQHVPDEEISLYLLQSGYRVVELIRHMVCWK